MLRGRGGGETLTKGALGKHSWSAARGGTYFLGKVHKLRRVRKRAGDYAGKRGKTRVEERYETGPREPPKKNPSNLPGRLMHKKRKKKGLSEPMLQTNNKNAKTKRGVPSLKTARGTWVYLTVERGKKNSTVVDKWATFPRGNGKLQKSNGEEVGRGLGEEKKLPKWFTQSENLL